VRRVAMGAVAVLLAVSLAGCFDVRSPDLFLITRTGPGGRLTVLVSYGGAVSCDGQHSGSLPDPMLIEARDLSDSLDGDASHGLTLPRTPQTVDYFQIRMPPGTISFPDSAAAGHPELAQAELFTLRVARRVCRVRG